MDSLSKFLSITLGTYLLISWLVLTDRASYSIPRWIVSFILPLSIAVYGYLRKSLDGNASVLAFVVGMIVTMANGSFSACMIAFFLTGSLLTKWKKQEKIKFESQDDTGRLRGRGQLHFIFHFSDKGRNWIQVFCNGAIASVTSILYLHSHKMGERHITLSQDADYTTTTSLAFISSIACCCGDTWASEIGIVLGTSPRLITTLKHVPKGTNGGVSMPGLLASAGGGLLIGVVYFISQWLLLDEVTSTTPQWLVLPLATAAGLVGSIIDSLLGATLQFSGCDEGGHISCSPGSNIKHIAGFNVLSNNGVNLLSSLLVAIVVPLFTVHFLNFY